MRAGRVAVHAPHALGTQLGCDRAHRVRALVEVGGFRTEQPRGQRGIRDEDLEGRAHVVLALDGAVGQAGEVRVDLRAAFDLPREQLVELGAVHPRVEPAVVERRVARHRQDLAGLVVHDRHRAGRSLVGHGGPGWTRRIERDGLLRAVSHDPRDHRVVGGELAALAELGLQQPLGVLLDIEVDRQLHVHPVHGLAAG